ncbi:MAG: glycerophosphodiester phosphodiesterase family protein [Myxococcales bacterium]|nr:glycerophosphodiester phosphodiesterase family protein [Myxococcales bacterium]
MHRIVVAACFLLACGSENTPPPGSGGGGAGTGGGGGSTPILDPALFDCTAPPPERVSTTPIGCGLDPTCRTPQVAAHRGAGGQLGKIAPEDTLAAYRAGIALGVDYVETDPRPTADGVIVNIHDDTVDRTTNGSGKVDELTFDAIRALEVKADAFAGDFGCEKIPTLEEILETCRGKVVVLVDANKTDRVDLLVAAIQNTDSIDWAIFDTSSVAKIDEALALEPTLHTMIRVDTLSQASDQLDHFAAHPPVIVEIDSAAPIEEIAAEVHARGNRAFTDVFGFDLAAFTDDDPSHYVGAFDRGLDIVQTDRPDLVLESLGRR